jgi:hypothetical protein
VAKEKERLAGKGKYRACPGPSCKRIDAQEEGNMQVSLVNKTKSLLIVTLSGGTSLHLAPGQISKPVDYMEVTGNEKIENLCRNGTLAIVSAQAT